MLKYIKKIINNNNTDETSILDVNSKRFEYISNSISKKKIEILESNDSIGGYYKNKLILPKTIHVSNNKIINIKCFLYKILFSTISNNKNYYLPENKNNLDYVLLASILTVKTINKKIKKIYPQFKNLIRELHPIIIKMRKDRYNKLPCLLELTLEKIMYEKNIYNNLNNQEKLIIYEIENITNITKMSLKKKLATIYKNLIKINKGYEKIHLNILWGYLYHNKINKETTEIKTILKDKNKKNINEIITQTNTIKNIKNISQDNTKTNLNLLFDYKKTIDNYTHGNKNTDNDSLDENSDILKSLDLNYRIKNTQNSTSILKTKTLNNVHTSNINNKKHNLKKYPYKEWDFKIKKYKNNWCNIFLKTQHMSNSENQIYIHNVIKLYKTDIKKLSEKISLITNEKIWKKKQLHGEEIDFDTLVENYTEVKNENFSKIYKFKKKLIKNITILLLFDSSLSTDGYMKEKKIIDVIKELTIILTCSIKNYISEHLIATFYSNTRHDCTYKIIKNLKEKDIKSNIKAINANGYTRIGPAIRHSIKELKKTHSKKKIIILITDGNPTDYDEYEGEYGINDIKFAITEAKKSKISTTCIITHTQPNQNFIKIFKNKNLTLNLTQNDISKQLIMFMKKILTE